MISLLIVNYFKIILLNILFLTTIFSVGSLGNNILKINTSNKNHILWLGIIFISIALMSLHFFFAISHYLNLIILSLSFFYLLYFQKINFNLIKRTIISNKLTLIFYFFCLIILTKSTLLYDTGLYHIQSIKWFNEYSLIPGLANLNDRFGFNIIYYYLSNYLVYPNTGNLSFISVSLFIYTLTFSTILNFDFKNCDKSVWLKFALLLGLAFKRYLVPSASPDLIVFSLEILVIGTTINYIFSPKKNDSDIIFVLFIVCFIFFNKISSIIFSFIFFLILVYFYSEIILRKINKKIILFVFIGFLLWIIRGYLLSGMPFYPNSIFILDSLDFSVEKQYADKLVLGIYNWSISPTIDSNTKVSLIVNFDLWLKNIMFYQKLYFIFIFSLFFLILLNIKKIYINKKLIIIFLGLISNIFIVLINLPQLRFVESSLVSLILILIIIFNETYKNNFLLNNVLINKFVKYSFSLFFIFIIFFKGEFNNTFSPTWNSNKYLGNNNYKIIENNKNYKVLTPLSNSDQCWDLPLPCTFNLNENLSQKKKSLFKKNFYYFSIK